MDCKNHYLDGSIDQCQLKERSELARAEINAQLSMRGLNGYDTERCELADGNSYKKCPFYTPYEI